MIVSIIALFILVAIYLIVVPALIADNFRQNLFEIREQLFVIGEDDHEFGFSHPIYRKFESDINTTIRIAHICTFWHVVIYASILKLFGGNQISKKEEVLEVFKKHSAEIYSAETKEKVKDLIDRYYAEIVFNVLVSAPITMCLILVTIIVPILVWDAKVKLEKILFGTIRSQSITYRHAH